MSTHTSSQQRLRQRKLCRGRDLEKVGAAVGGQWEEEKLVLMDVLFFACPFLCTITRTTTLAISLETEQIMSRWRHLKNTLALPPPPEQC